MNASLTPRRPAARIAAMLALLGLAATPLASLAAFLQGVGAAEATDGSQLSAADALAAAGVEAPGLSTAERAVLTDGQGAAAGTAALCVQAGKLLLASANAVAALSETWVMLTESSSMAEARLVAASFCAVVLATTLSELARTDSATSRTEALARFTSPIRAPT